MSLADLLNEKTLAIVRNGPMGERQTLMRTLPGASSLSAGLEGTLPPIPLEDAPPVPAQLHLGERLGLGGMAEVLRGWQVALKRDVAVKVARRDVDAEVHGALVREGRIMGGLEHPNIVPVHSLGVDSADRPLLVMKRIKGREWLEVLDEEARGDDGLLPPERLEHHLGIFRQVCNAVHFAHSHGVIHRDLKPANVMIGAYGEVYVLDWGIAIEMQNPGDEEGYVVGTLRYMAPEMLVGTTRDVSPRTDIYLLGATLHRVLTGRPRHGGKTRDSIMESILGTGEIPYPKGLASELISICRKAMAHKPADRFPDVAALSQAVADYLRHRGSVDLSDAAWVSLRAFDQAIKAAHTLDEGASLRLYQRLGECRFAFQQALLPWPQNPAAQEGLQIAIRRLIEWELRREDGEAASRLLQELPEPDPGLATRVEALQARNRKRAEKLKALENIAFDLDPTVAGKWKAIFAVGFAFLTLFSSLVEGHFIKLGVLTSGDAISLFTSSAVVALLSATLFLLRRQLFLNSANKLMAGSVLLGTVFFFFNRLRAYLVEAPLLEATINEPLIFSLTAALAALALDRRLALASAVWLLSYFVASYAPSEANVAIGVGNALAILGVGGLWMRSSSASPWAASGEGSVNDLA